MNDDPRDQVREMSDEIKEQARTRADEMEQQVREKGEEIRARVEERGEEQKERAAGTAEALADAIRAAGSTLRDRHEDRLGQFTDELADQVDRVSGYLRDNDMRGLMHNLEDVARRNPAGFLGSTLAAGLVAGRFLRASGRDSDSGAGSDHTRRDPAAAPHRPPSHQEFASNSPTPELHTPREPSGSSSPARTSGPLRETTYSSGGPRS